MYRQPPESSRIAMPSKVRPDSASFKLAGLGIPLLLATTMISAGCAMCCGPHDYDYPVFGGRITRADPVYGRVGSVFSDPNMAGAGPAADSNIDEIPLKPNQVLRDPVRDTMDAGEGVLPIPAPREAPSGGPPQQPDDLSPSDERPDRETLNRWVPSGPGTGRLGALPAPR